MASPQYHWKRRIVQIATLLLIALIPALGLFRIDLSNASFAILDSRYGGRISLSSSDWHSFLPPCPLSFT